MNSCPTSFPPSPLQITETDSPSSNSAQMNTGDYLERPRTPSNSPEYWTKSPLSNRCLISDIEAISQRTWSELIQEAQNQHIPYYTFGVVEWQDIEKSSSGKESSSKKTRYSYYDGQYLQEYLQTSPNAQDPCTQMKIFKVYYVAIQCLQINSEGALQSLPSEKWTFSYLLDPEDSESFFLKMDASNPRLNESVEDKTALALVQYELSQILQKRSPLLPYATPISVPPLFSIKEVTLENEIPPSPKTTPSVTSKLLWLAGASEEGNPDAQLQYAKYLLLSSFEYQDSGLAQAIEYLKKSAQNSDNNNYSQGEAIALLSFLLFKFSNPTDEKNRKLALHCYKISKRLKYPPSKFSIENIIRFSSILLELLQYSPPKKQRLSKQSIRNSLFDACVSVRKNSPVCEDIPPHRKKKAR